MTFTIRDRKTERLLAELAERTGDHRSGAIRQLLEAECRRLRRGAGEGAASGHPSPMGDSALVPVVALTLARSGD